MDALKEKEGRKEGRKIEDRRAVSEVEESDADHLIGWNGDKNDDCNLDGLNNGTTHV